MTDPISYAIFMLPIKHLFYSRLFEHNQMIHNIQPNLVIGKSFFVFYNSKIHCFICTAKQTDSLNVSISWYAIIYFLHTLCTTDPSHHLLIQRYQSFKNWFEDEVFICVLFGYDVRINIKAKPTVVVKSPKTILAFIASHIIKYSFTIQSAASNSLLFFQIKCFAIMHKILFHE